MEVQWQPLQEDTLGLARTAPGLVITLRITQQLFGIASTLG